MSVSPDAVKQLFWTAAEKPAAERAAFLTEACGGDTTLRERVERLLHAHDRPPDFLDQPAVPPAAPDDSLAFLGPSDKPGSLGRLGHYEAQEVLGKGGMGIVLRAFDEKLHRVVAIKALAPQLATTGAARQRFVREARAAAAVTHDNVVAIYGVEDAGPVPYLVMQCVHGKTLQEKLDRDGPMSPAEVLRVGLQIADGLAAAHRHGLVHRDVKPANILLENSVERVKITDFGLARAVDDASLTQSGLIAGTPMYMSPEQANGEKVDHRSDLFSLGSVMYAMCAGHPPFRADSTPAILKRVAHDEPRPLPEVNAAVPDWLAAVVETLMAKAPADRVQTAAEVSALLGAHLAHLQGRGDRPPPLPRPKRRGGRRAVVSAVAVVVVIGTMAVTLAVRPWERQPPAVPSPDPPGNVAQPVVPVVGAGPAEIPAPKKFASVGPPQFASSLIDPTVLASRPAAADALDRKNIPADLLTAAFGADAKKVPPQVVAILGEDRHKGKPNQACQMYTLAFSPDGKVLASGGVDRVVRLWDTATGKLKQELKGFSHAEGYSVYSLAFSPDGKTLAAANWLGELKLWDAETGKDLATLAPPGRRVNQLSFSPDGRRLAVARTVGDVQFWDVAKKSLEKTIHAGGGEVWCLAFSPDGGTLAAGVGSNVRFWTVPEWKQPRGQLVANGTVRWIGYHPLGNTMATAGMTAPGQNLGVQIWDIEARTAFKELDGHTSTVLTGAWRADGYLLATAGETDGTVRVWDGTQNMRGHAIKVVPPNVPWLCAIAMSPEGRYLAVSHPAGMILILRLAKPGEAFWVPKG